MSEAKWERVGTILLPSGQAFELQTNELGFDHSTGVEALAMWARSFKNGDPVWWGAGFRLVPVGPPTMTCSVAPVVDLSASWLTATVPPASAGGNVGVAVPPTLTAADIYAAVNAAWDAAEDKATAPGVPLRCDPPPGNPPATGRFPTATAPWTKDALVPGTDYELVPPDPPATEPFKLYLRPGAEEVCAALGIPVPNVPTKADESRGDPPAFKCATCRDKGRVVTGADGHGDGRITTHTAPCPDCGPML